MKPSVYKHEQTYDQYRDRVLEMINMETRDLIAKVDAQSLTEKDKKSIASGIIIQITKKFGL